MSNTHVILYALVGGILPALVWLFFWLREDSKRPEPKGRLAETFLAGMLAVIAVLPFQKMIAQAFPGLGITTFALWALLEEAFKFLAAFVIALRSRDDDEPIDALVYMITAALGFAALENALFIWNPLLTNDIPGALSTGGMRFIGASLLHVLASSVIGLALARAFYKSRLSKIIHAAVGLACAVAVHTAFNVFILHQTNAQAISTFGTVWIGAAALIFFFERVKAIAR